MFQAPPREKEWISWLLAGVWTLILYVTVPFARSIEAIVVRRFGSTGIFIYLVIVAVLAAGSIVIAYIIRSYKSIPWTKFLAVLAAMGAFIYFATQLTKTPIEALHFIEYGFLGLLLYRALSHRVGDYLIYVSAVLMGAAIGTVDEVIQWITPRRIWDWRDVFFNSLSVVLMQLTIALAIRPSIISFRAQPASIRLACRLSLALLVLVGLCLVNTPDRVEWYADRVPGLGFLERNESMMTEYGHRHVNPEIGVFYSRFSLEELEREDSTRGKEAAVILNQWRRHDQYPEFLRLYTPAIDPFAHEARVHFFRRDHHMGLLWPRRHDVPMNEGLDEDAKRFHCTVAYREYRIMEKYFPNTLSNSLYVLSTAERSALESGASDANRYVSPVSGELITWFAEKQVPAFVLVMILVAMGVDCCYGKPRHRQQQRGSCPVS